MLTHTKRTRAWTVYAAILILALVPALYAPIARGQDGPAEGETAVSTLSEESEECMACHAGDMEDAPAVNLAAHLKSPHADMDCLSCHAEYTAEYPHTEAMKASRVDCATCHDTEGYEASVHARPDKVPGDHPTCASCHIGRGDPHAIRFVDAERSPDAWTRVETTEACAKCHADAERMARYGVDPEAAPSYHESFHGRALLRFGKDDSAGCVDCHRAHEVLSPGDPDAPTHPTHIEDTCARCHPGAEMNFAMSGANHLSLRVEGEPLLRAERLFFRWLTVGTIVVLLIGIALDLRRKVFGARADMPTARAAGILVSASFLALVSALALAYFGRGGAAAWLAILALALMAGAFVAHQAQREGRARGDGERVFQRLTLAQRIQHGLLALSFTLLALTGMPLRFAHVEWMHGIYTLFGGLDGARLVHRGAGVVMIAVWIWHTAYLLYRWRKAGWSLGSWSMVPTRKDAADVLHSIRYGLGLAPGEPRYDRFQFREKFDYLAVYWGMPIMVLSGLVLWFPVYFGNRLPDIAIAVSFIAHSDEAILAFLAIVTWHMYNVHFNPHSFPMSNTWLTGTKTREEMAREHPLELERLE